MPSWHTIIISIVTAAMGGLVWLIRLEQQVQYLQRKLTDQTVEREKTLERLSRQLDRIEAKVHNIALRCSAFHFQGGTLAPPTLEEHEDDKEG
jgi:hypothetical protein